MRRPSRPLLVTIPWAVAASAACAAVGTGQETERPYLAGAHSHNDYERRAPLTDALARGFASIEVDVVLRDGELLVAHEEDEVEPTLTLRRLYLDPLRELTRESGGWLFSAGQSLQLLVDVKTNAEVTYRALDELFGEYGDLFTTWTPRGPEPGPVTAVLSGNRALARFDADTLRYVAVDGRIDEVRVLPPEAMPLVSVDWEDLASTRKERLARARQLVRTVHAEGRKIRFWGTPDDEELWAALLSAGVDYIGTDDPARLERLLRSDGRRGEAYRRRRRPRMSGFISRRSSASRRPVRRARHSHDPLGSPETPIHGPA